MTWGDLFWGLVWSIGPTVTFWIVIPVLLSLAFGS